MFTGVLGYNYTIYRIQRNAFVMNLLTSEYKNHFYLCFEDSSFRLHIGSTWYYTSFLKTAVFGDFVGEKVYHNSIFFEARSYLRILASEIDFVWAR